jgi:hypothetical protein
VHFTLPANAQDPVLYIAQLWVDDRMVVALNGHVIADGSTCCVVGNGYMTYRDGGPNRPRTFSHVDGRLGLTVTSGLVAGDNTLTAIINNTGEGVLGVPVPVTSYNPSWFGMTGGVSYATGP